VRMLANYAVSGLCGCGGILTSRMLRTSGSVAIGERWILQNSNTAATQDIKLTQMSFFFFCH
jgi:hypothetical protein